MSVVTSLLALRQRLTDEGKIFSIQVGKELRSLESWLEKKFKVADRNFIELGEFTLTEMPAGAFYKYRGYPSIHSHHHEYEPLSAYLAALPIKVRIYPTQAHKDKKAKLVADTDKPKMGQHVADTDDEEDDIE